MLYSFISIILTSILVPLILRFIVFKSQSTKSSTIYTFKYPRFLTIFFCIPIIMIIILFVWAYLSNEQGTLGLYVFLYAFYSLFTIALIWCILRTFNFELILEEDYMLYRNFFGISNKIKYKEITRINAYNDKLHNPVKYRIYIGNRVITLDNFTINFSNFPKLMKKRLRMSKSIVQF